jgi:hypothetical protein
LAVVWLVRLILPVVVKSVTPPSNAWQHSSLVTRKTRVGGEDDAGYIAWQLWGGDAGRAWANRIIKMVEGRKEQS